MRVGPFRDGTDHDDARRFLVATYPSTFLVMCTLVVEVPVHQFANVVVVHNPVVALDIQVVDVVNSDIRLPSHALTLFFVLLELTTLYILHVVTMVDHHSFAPETSPLMVVVVLLDTDLVAVVHDPAVGIRFANAAAVVDHASRNAAVEVLHNILRVVRGMEVDHSVEYRLRNAAPVAAVVGDIVGIDQRVVEVSIAIRRRLFHHRLVLNAYSFFLLVQEM